MRRARFPLFSAEGMLVRALLIVPVHFVLLWGLTGRNLASALLAPSTAMSLGTSFAGALFALVRLATVFVLPGVIASCVFVIAVKRVAAAREQ